MMFSLSFAVVLVLACGINGQTNDINTFHTNVLEKGYPFGKLRLAEEGGNEELIPTIDIEKSHINQDQPSGVQPLPSPCIGTTSLTKIAYPKEKTKYIQCRDEFHYEIFTCPNGGEYNEQTDSCDLILPMIDKCEQEKPCFNDGQCTLLSNSTFKCICRQDWTGDRCETPINSCVKKPCGPNAECRPLKTTEYEQDYVCVCHGTKGYGPNCQEVVPNPCLTTSEQFFQYAFSQHAYIQCDGDLIYFQPCGPLLYWNQEDKICDRKRPPKIDLPALLMKFVSNNNDNQQENGKEMINEGMTLTTTTQPEQQNSFFQNEKENEKVFAFVPARVANRQQLLASINNQQDQLSQPVQSNQTQQNSMSKTRQWPNQQIPTMQLGQNQPWSQNTQQQQWASTFPGASAINSNPGQSPFGQTGQQQWTPTLPGASAINSNPGQSPFGQTSQQQWASTFPGASAINANPGQSQFGQTGQQQWGSTFPGASAINANPGQSQFGQTGQQQWAPTLPGASAITANPGQSQFGQTGQQQWGSTFPGASAINSNPGQSPFGQTGQQQWGSTFPGASAINANPGQSQFGQTGQQQWAPTLPGASSINANPIQSPFGQTGQQQWGSTFPGASAINANPGQSPFGQNNQQQWAPTLPGASSINANPGQSPFGQNNQQQNFPQQNPVFSNPQWSNQVPDLSTQNNQNFGSQSQLWQGSQAIQNQPLFPAQKQKTLLESTTPIPQNVNRSQVLQKPNAQAQDQSWQNKPNTQWTGFQSPQVAGFNTQSTLSVVSQPQSWQNSQTIQNQPRLQDQNQQTLLETTTPAQNVGRLQGFQSSNAQTQEQPWQNRPSTQGTGYQSVGFSTQNLVPQSQSWQTVQTEQLPSTLNPQSSTSLKTGQLQNFPQQSQILGSQQWSNQVADTNTQSNQRVGSQSQLWQGSQPIQSQPQYPAQNQQTLFETTTKTTIPQNINRFQGFQNPSTQEQDQSWQKRQNIVNKPQSNQIFAFQPKQWPETSKQTQQSLIAANPSSEIQNTQFGFNQQVQPQGSQLTDSDDLKFQTNQNFAARSSFETATVPNNGINQGSRGWQPSQTVEQRQTLDSAPTLLSGSWKSRSY